MKSQKAYLTIFFAALFVAIYFIKSQFTGELYQDEIHYYPTAEFFSAEIIPSLDILKNYRELNTPVPFILGGWVIKAFGSDIQYLRLLTLGVSFALLMIFIWSSPKHPKRLILCIAGLVAFPNYYLVSAYYYTDIFAMFFILAGTASYLKKWHVFGMFFFYCRRC